MNPMEFEKSLTESLSPKSECVENEVVHQSEDSSTLRFRGKDEKTPLRLTSASTANEITAHNDHTPKNSQSGNTVLAKSPDNGINLETNQKEEELGLQPQSTNLDEWIRQLENGNIHEHVYALNALQEVLFQAEEPRVYSTVVKTRKDSGVEDLESDSSKEIKKVFNRLKDLAKETLNRDLLLHLVLFFSTTLAKRTKRLDSALTDELPELIEKINERFLKISKNYKPTKLTPYAIKTCFRLTTKPLAAFFPAEFVEGGEHPSKRHLDVTMMANLALLLFIRLAIHRYATLPNIIMNEFLHISPSKGIRKAPRLQADKFYWGTKYTMEILNNNSSLLKDIQQILSNTDDPFPIKDLTAVEELMLIMMSIVMEAQRERVLTQQRISVHNTELLEVESRIRTLPGNDGIMPSPSFSQGEELLKQETQLHLLLKELGDPKEFRTDFLEHLKKIKSTTCLPSQKLIDEVIKTWPTDWSSIPADPRLPVEFPPIVKVEAPARGTIEESPIEDTASVRLNCYKPIVFMLKKFFDWKGEKVF
ncbi:hypothetical protein CROQUDRAFT_91312 [Cronartium quercuum f. sp. fusiforme G11]|uniref:Uncharacterized protein n=1 Tax=Cronartium quercuum f. sp. fusiforme G11 TaxID=708437 RepID=A0A9P6NQ95_9BASI|nr:hypothetical protein CROQUDRAFT_91312 [Cronartium quercuum f. sp. fusiforme G11]